MIFRSIDLPNFGYSEKNAQLDTYIQQKVTIDPDYRMPAIIICPGGGYEFISNRESEPMALSFAAQGYQAFVLNYSIINKESTEELLPYPLLELGYTVKYIREHADEWNIDPNKIVLLGCSAGGHLSALYNGVWHQEWLAEKLQTSTESLKPNATILCYALVSFDTITIHPALAEAVKKITTNEEYRHVDQLVGEQTSPTFIWHTAADETTPVENAWVYASQLSKNKIPFETHIFHKGRHGLSLADKTTAKLQTDDYIVPHVANWFPLCIEWLDETL